MNPTATSTHAEGQSPTATLALAPSDPLWRASRRVARGDWVGRVAKGDSGGSMAKYYNTGFSIGDSQPAMKGITEGRRRDSGDGNTKGGKEEGKR